MRVCMTVSVLHIAAFVGYTLTSDCPIHLTHDSLPVEYGQSAEVNCSLTNARPADSYKLGWEVTENPTETEKDSSVVWRVSNLTRWDINQDKLFCYLTNGAISLQCKKRLHLTLYKRPDSVMIHSQSRVWSEGKLGKLMCVIKSVGPVSNLTVQWTRVDQNGTRTFINSNSFIISGNKNNAVDVNDTLEVPASHDVDGVQYQCAALLKLDHLDQPQVGKSQSFNITLHYKPIITKPSSGSISVTEGNPLILICLARGNPDPQYTWTSPSNSRHSSVLNISNVQSEHQGKYICKASNDEGSDTVTVNVDTNACTSVHTHICGYLICGNILLMFLSRLFTLQ